MLNYINMSQRDYYENGFLKKDSNFTAIEADHKIVSAIVGGLVQLAGIGLRAVIASQISTNKYRLPR